MSTGVEGSAYESLLARGQLQNRAAVATGVTGGVLTAIGGSLLAVAATRQRRDQRAKRIAVRPVLGGIGVRF